MVAIMNDDNDNYDLDAVRPTVVEEKRAVKKVGTRWNPLVNVLNALADSRLSPQPSIKIKKRKSATTRGDDDCKDDAEKSSAKKSSKKSRKTSENDMIAVDSDADDNRDDESAPPKTDKKEKRSKKDKKEKKSKKPRKTIEEAVAALTGTSGTSATATSAKKSNEFGVWIGNLSFSTTAEQVRDFFKDCGEIVRLHLPVNAATTAGPKGIFKNKGYVEVHVAWCVCARACLT